MHLCPDEIVPLLGFAGVAGIYLKRICQGVAASIRRAAAYAGRRWTMARFRMESRPEQKFEDLADAAQEAEFLHAETGVPHCVLAEADEPGWSRDEAVYVSQGAPE